MGRGLVTGPLSCEGAAFADSATDTRLRALAERQGTPFYVYDSATLDRRWALLRAILPEAAALYYSVKANPHPSVVARFGSLGAGLEVVSEGELEIALASGVAPERIVCVGPGKRQTFIAAALAAGVGALVAESARDLRLAHDAAVALGRRGVPVWLRLNPGRGQAGVCMSGDTPFGLDEATAIRLARDLEENPRLRLTGLHAYMGTGVLGGEALVANSLQAAHAMARVLDAARIHTLETFDLGGGFGLMYEAHRPQPDWSGLRGRLGEVQAVLASALARGARLAFESGRFLVGPAGAFVTRVLDRKAAGASAFVILDGGTNVFSGAGGPFGLRAVPVRLVRETATVPPEEPEPEEPEEPEEIVTLCGPLCTSTDRLAVRVALPPPREGDLAVFLLAGAYGFSAAPGLFLGHGFPAQHWLDEAASEEGRAVGKSGLPPFQTDILQENQEGWEG